jgi:uncharacterized protein (TIGR03086 family)
VTVLDLDRRALTRTGQIIDAVTTADLARPTPCEKWSLSRLLEHVVNENHGYGNSSMGAPAIVSIWYSADLKPDPQRAYQASADWVTHAFTDPGLWDPFEVREFGYFPAQVAFGMHFVDILVHGWDIAVSIGQPYRPDDESVAAALAIVATWPRTSPRLREFGRRVTVPDDAPDFARLLGLLGRSPSWTPAS